MNRKPHLIELLSPARDAHVAIEAINHGADAVYMGPSRFGARAMAGNSIDDIARVCDYAHKFRARVYATVNTIVYDNELAHVERLIHELYRAQVDALIVQDLGVLRLDIPPIALHASTQCDIRTPEQAQFLQGLGFSQLVLARELSLSEIKAVRDSVKVPLEAFVHGALCVSYSGRCGLSQAVKGRSANRGQCAQMCRLPYDLEDEFGNKLITDKHLLSLRDLNRSQYLEEMLQAGISSFKIEGRLKDVGYVKNVVAHYSQMLDEIITSSDGAYKRLSSGESRIDFEPNVHRSFNRSFTPYFINGRDIKARMASIDTPKSLGESMGVVTSVRGKELKIATESTLANGDGLSFFNNEGQFCGVRVNVVRGNSVQLRESVSIKPGTLVYRTHDKAFEDIIQRESAKRLIAVNACLSYIPGRLVLSLDDARGNSVTHSVELLTLDEARTPQGQRQRDVLAKLGDTIYYLNECSSLVEDKFVPASVLATLRRETIDLLDRANDMTHPRELRRKEDMTIVCPNENLDHANNVANHLSMQVYRDHGVHSITPSIETLDLDDVDNPVEVYPVLMHTRYCLRRELGACRMDAKAKQLPSKLFLRNGKTLLNVECDCAQCEMKITLASD